MPSSTVLQSQGKQKVERRGKAMDLEAYARSDGKLLIKTRPGRSALANEQRHQ